ncbi:hypothetical protein PR202_ga00097 [Eleusine coracana subsp. coracana]|uniref:Uncharacterized protein n=1 Tax=Eleusine coracana subsp. coracana TaxID=191504 RepID=A0AAV5BGK3_ELECO|nr:hypothetical protein PR202_ga00097 [Eleusine coracana subsp. coracana]
MSHNIADGFGMVQFVRAVAELARGEAVPTILPIWKRDLLTALEQMIVEYFLFGPSEIATLQSHIGAYPANSVTSFELLTAIMWRCRTIALGYKANQQVRLMITMNARGKWNRHTLIPRGYYGNAHLSPILEATVDELCNQPLANTVELVRKTKLSVTKACMKSMVDTIALTGQWPPLMMDRIYEVSDTKWIATSVTRFGWAELVGGGIPLAGDLTSKLGSDHMRCRNESAKGPPPPLPTVPRTVEPPIQPSLDFANDAREIGEAVVTGG